MRRFGVLLGLCVGGLAHADTAEYARKLRAAQERDKEISRRMVKLGIAPASDTSGVKDDIKPPRPLLQTHGDLSTRVSTAGHFVFGRTVVRLVVGPEGAPAILELDPDQGVFSRLRVLAHARHHTTYWRT